VTTAVFALEHDQKQSLVENLRSGAARETVVGDDTEHKGREPEDHRQEREGLSSLPLATVVAAAERDATPSPGRTALGAVEPANEKSEDSSPAGSEDWSHF
jgi:hypothetical protein